MAIPSTQFERAGFLAQSLIVLGLQLQENKQNEAQYGVGNGGPVQKTAWNAGALFLVLHE